MKIIAIPSNGEEVSQHFGHCSKFYLITVDGNNILKKEFIDNPGHQPGFLPGFLNEKGVNCIIAEGMGTRAIALFQENKIEVITGASGSLDKLIEEYLKGSLKTEDNICDH